MCASKCLVWHCNVKRSFVSLLLTCDEMCGKQTDLRAIVMDRATANLLFNAEQAGRPLVERDRV